MGRLKWLILLLLLPFFAKADDTAALNALLAAGNVILPGGHAPYSVSSSLNVTHNFNLSGNTINFTGIGSELKVSAGVTVQGGSLMGLTGSVASNQSAIQPLTGASGITIIGMTISKFGQYGISSTNNSGLSITNCIISDIGLEAISEITNAGVNTGINISGNTINRGMQPSNVPQAAIIIRNFAPGVQTGTIVATNIITMPANPSIVAAEIIEFRGVVHAQFHDNICIGGSIGCSAVLGSNNFQCFNNVFSGQNNEAMECGDLLNSTFHNNTITSGKIGMLFDGGSLCTLDTLSNIPMSGLTGVPIQFDSRFVHEITVNAITASTVTNAMLVSTGAYNIYINNSTFSGNNTTYTVKFDNSPGQMYLTNTSFPGFTPKIMAGTASSATTVNNIIGTGITPTGGTFLTVQAGTNVTLGPNISFNALPAHPVPAYSPTSYSNYINTALPTITPTNSGGTATSWSITPTQPAGINFNTSTGVFTGTPLALTTTTTYTVSASNIGGTGTTPITFTIINNPPIISFSPSSQVCTINSSITPMNVVNSGGAIISATSSPALPAGLTLSSGGNITGSPTVTLPSTSFVITCYNSGGNSSTTINLTINPPAPAAPNISFSPNTYSLPISTAISPITPINVGGVPSSWAIGSSLPSGLSFSTSTGQITGLPTTLLASTPFDISATNITGTSHTTLNLAVVNIPPAMPSFSYSPSDITLTINQSGLLLAPNSTGGTVSNWSVLPSLPTGLSIDSSTGIISGVATVLTTPTGYVISGTNITGTSHFTVTFSVVPQSPGVSIRIGGFIAKFE